MASLGRLEQADRSRGLAHRICVGDEILGWLAREREQPAREGLLWALLLRSHGYRCPGSPERERHAQLVAAVVEDYRDAPDALIASTRSLALDADTRLAIVLAAAQARPQDTEAWLVEELVAAAAAGGLEQRVAQGLRLLAARPPSEAALPVLREWVDTDRAPLAAAAAALRAGSRQPEDVLRLLALALRDPRAMVGVEGWG
jgi:hypothetical protein